jgi:3'-phosphoadenosine 5'-phosphosulfate sulfotransferase (PAPS reductase)/FAD synthetase
MMQQLSFMEPLPAHQPPRAPSLPTDPTAIIVSVSGGLDSVACALWARQRWPERELILWHAYLAEMDWPQTDAQLRHLAQTIGQCRLVSVQAIYARTGALTPTGAARTTLLGLHTVRDGDQWFGPASAADDQSDTILTLLDFAQKARHGQPPTSKIRWCTSYFKAAVCDRWLREQREDLGARPVLLSGERHAESPGRAKLPPTQWRFGTKGWDVLWARPVIDWPWHQVVQASVDAGIAPHPGYALQGETLEAMRDPTRDERGRARLSCIACIFAHPHHIATALNNDPTTVGPVVRLVQQYEQDTGYSWQQRGRLLAGVLDHPNGMASASERMNAISS